VCIALRPLLDLEKKAVVLYRRHLSVHRMPLGCSAADDIRSARAAAQFPGSRYRSDDDAQSLGVTGSERH